jgi:hypothetical protein
MPSGGLPPVSKNLLIAGFICPGGNVQVDMNFIILSCKKISNTQVDYVRVVDLDSGACKSDICAIGFVYRKPLPS